MISENLLNAENDFFDNLKACLILVNFKVLSEICKKVNKNFFNYTTTT